MRSSNGVLGTLFLGITFAAAITSAFWTPYDPIIMDLHDRFAEPSFSHWAGTDEWGRDLLSRILSGAGISVVVSLSSVVFALIVGTVIGGFSGFYGGWLDRLVMLVTDSLLAFPGILMALAIMTIIGPSALGVILALGLVYTPRVTRLVRGTVLSLREKEYTEASRALGNSACYTLVRHILPNSLAPLIVMGTALFGSALLSESALSFLGLGVPPPASTWGNMLSEARLYFSEAPRLAFIPGVCISVVLLGVNLFGDALRDRLDPRMRNL